MYLGYCGVHIPDRMLIVSLVTSEPICKFGHLDSCCIDNYMYGTVGYLTALKGMVNRTTNTKESLSMLKGARI